MASTPTPLFTCTACQKRYRWQERLAGRRVRCTCGQVMQMPWEAPADTAAMGAAANALQNDSIGYELGEIPPDTPHTASTTAGGNRTHCPGCGGVIRAGAVLCVQCGFNLATGQRLNTQVVEPAVSDVTPVSADADVPHIPLAAQLSGRPVTEAVLRKREEDRLRQEAYDLKMHRFREFHLPILMLIGGVLAIVGGSVWLLRDVSLTAGLLFAAGLLAVELVVMVPVLLVSLFLAARILDLAFGNLFTAILKLTAICAGPGAIGDIVLLIVSPLLAMSLFAMVGAVFLIHLIFLGLPIGLLFNLDFDDMSKTIGVAIVVRMMAVLLLVTTLFSLFS